MAGRPRKSRLEETLAEARTPAPPVPDLPAEASAKDRVTAHVLWLKSKMTWAQDNNASINELSTLSNQYQSACRQLALLNGEGKITIPQIIRSPAWADIMRCLRESLGKHPEVLQELIMALEELDGGVKRVQ